MIQNPYLKLSAHIKKEYDLSQNEAAALTAIKSDQSKYINPTLRERIDNPEIKETVMNLDSGLEKLPSYNDSTVYRNFNFSKSQQKKVKNFFENNIGKTIQFQDYQSCTKRRIFAGNKKYYNLTIMINTDSNSAGKDIDKIYKDCGLKDSEEEVLFKRRICFIIEKVNFKDYIKVILTETKNENPIVFPNF